MPLRPSSWPLHPVQGANRGHVPTNPRRTTRDLAKQVIERIQVSSIIQPRPGRHARDEEVDRQQDARRGDRAPKPAELLSGPPDHHHEVRGEDHPAQDEADLLRPRSCTGPGMRLAGTTGAALVTSPAIRTGGIDLAARDSGGEMDLPDDSRSSDPERAMAPIPDASLRRGPFEAQKAKRKSRTSAMKPR